MTGTELSPLPAFLNFKTTKLPATPEKVALWNLEPANQLNVWKNAALQEEDNWCWVAVAAALHRAYRSRTITQCEIVRDCRDHGYITGSGDPCANPDGFDVQHSVAMAADLISDIDLNERDRQDYPDLKAWLDYQLSLDMPQAIPLVIKFSGTNHSVCVFGIAPGGRYHVFDPAEGLFICDFEDFDDYDESGENGRWIYFYSWDGG